MMDSQENALLQGNAGEQVENIMPTAETTTAAAAEVAETAEPEQTPTPVSEPEASEPETPAAEAESVTADDEPKAVEQKVYENKKEVLQRVSEIAHGEEAPAKEEVEYLKAVFYRLHQQDREAQLKEFLDGGGSPDAYTPMPDEDEEVFKREMALIRERRQQLFREQEAEKEANLKKKLDIIEKIKAMLTSPEEVSRCYQDFKALQQEWKEIRNVPAENASELWRNYQLYVEQFYDLLKLNNEAREYDFKKNLEAKLRLCEAAEKLADEPDVVSAFHQLQKLHQEYREIGPVAKDLREEVWKRFKDASTVINKRHQQHFEQLRAQEEENLAKKTELCERAEAILAEENKNAADWEAHTEQIIALQKEWKTIGFTPQKMNIRIFERFRTACDAFFTAKTDHFRQLREQYKQNAERKRELIEKAKALMDSTDWRSTGDKIIALQKEWKTIGMVPKKLGDQLWEEFLAACNHFFEARNEATSGQRNEERQNLEHKRDVIERLRQLAENPTDNIQELVSRLTEEYNGIGHVPFREKDKLYADYREVLDRLHRELNISTARRRLNRFRDNIRQVAERGEQALDNERARLMRQYEAIKQEVKTYENNLGFLTASSKKGNSLIEEMNRKIQKLRDEMQLVLEKIKAVDAENSANSEEA